MAPKPLLLPALLSASLATALQNGFGQTPVMGFNTYNAAACTINQTFIQDYINYFDSLGFGDVGYKIFSLDCGWQGTSRQSNGSIDYSHNDFPDGIAPLAQQAISKGFQWGMYTDEGEYACDFDGPTTPGSKGYEEQDALQFAGWNTEYLKVDNCYVNGSSGADDAPKTPAWDFPGRYGAMQDALHDVGIEGMLVCQWGVAYTNDSGLLYGPAQWTPPLSTSFRVSDDIAQGWDNVMRIINENINVCVRGLSGPGNFADMDLLEVGNTGMTVDEQMTHFAAWAFMKSTLMVSTRLDTISSQTTQILQNKDIIAINQDSLGKPVTLAHRFTNDNDQFSGPLANGDLAVLLTDQSNSQRSLGIYFTDYGISSATVKNLWTGETQSNVDQYFTNVNAHGSVPLRLSNIAYTNAPAPELTWIEATSGTLGGSANVQSCPGCTNGQKVGYLGGGGNSPGTVTFSNIFTSESSQDVRFDYINCEVQFGGSGANANTRGASISVNGNEPVTVLFPISGYEWTRDVYQSYLVRLYGFNTSGPNTIEIGGASTSQYAPDLSRIGVVSSLD